MLFVYMRPLVYFVITSFYLISNIVVTFSPPPPPLRHFLRYRILESHLDLSIYEVFQLLLLVLVLITFIYLICFETFSARYITFDTNLSTLKKRSFTNPSEIWAWLPMILLGLFFSDCSYETKVVWVIYICPISIFLLSRVFKLSRIFAFLSTIILSFYLLLIAVSPVAHILSLVITFILCSFITRNVPTWVSLLIILLSNDIELHPGPQYQENFFSFMNGNLNYIAKNNFERVQLIEAHNSIYNYDLISL